MIKKIVCADNDSAVRDAIQKLFSTDDFEFFFAPDGQQALKLVQDHVPHVLIIDALIPGLSAYDACKTIKNDPRTKDIPVIVVSAKSSMEDSFLFLGIKDFLSKPLDIDQLAARVRRRLDLAAAMHMQKTKILFHGTNAGTMEHIKELFDAVPQWDAVYVNSGEELLRKAQECVPDVIVIDLFIRDMHIDRAVSQLKAMPSMANTDILTYYSPFSSSQDGIALQAKMLEVQYLKRISGESGAKEYLGPFNPANFVGLFDDYRKDLLRN